MLWQSVFATSTARSIQCLYAFFRQENGSYTSRFSGKTEGIMNMRSFKAPGVYKTEDEADLHGIAYGQRIIDGKVPGLTVGN